MATNSNTRSDATISVTYSNKAPGDRIDDPTIFELERRVIATITEAAAIGDAVVSQTPPDDKTKICYIADDNGVPTGEQYAWNELTGQWESTTADAPEVPCLSDDSAQTMTVDAQGCWLVSANDIANIAAGASPSISADAGNLLVQGSDAGWYVPYVEPTPSTDADNITVIGSDGKLYTPPPSVSNGVLGWGQYGDSLYTSVSPMSVANEVKQITIDGLAVTVTDQLPSSGDLWNTIVNKVIPVNDGDAYAFRMTFKVKGAATALTYDLFLDIGGGVGEIFRKTRNVNKGVGQVFHDSLHLSFFAGATFLANGGTFYLDTTESGNTIEAYDFSIFLEKTYEAHV